MRARPIYLLYIIKYARFFSNENLKFVFKKIFKILYISLTTILVSCHSAELLSELSLRGVLFSSGYNNFRLPSRRKIFRRRPAGNNVNKFPGRYTRGHTGENTSCMHIVSRFLEQERQEKKKTSAGIGSTDDLIEIRRDITLIITHRAT